MKVKIFSLALIAIFAFSTTTFAQRGQVDNRMNRKQMMKKHQSLNNDRESFFTDEQKEQVKQLRLETAKKVKPLKNELNELMAHQKTLTTAEDVKLKAIHSNIEEMSELKTEIAKILATQHQEIRSLLTEEQLLKFDQRRHGMKGRMNKQPMRGQREFHRAPGRG